MCFVCSSTNLSSSFFFKYCFSSWSPIDFSSIDCGFLLLCRSAGRGSLLSVSGFFSLGVLEKPPPRFSVNNYSHFVGNIPLVLLFGLKHLCASVHRGFCRRQAEQKGCFFTTAQGALPLSNAPGSHWAGFVKGIPVNIPPSPPSAFLLSACLSAASQHSTVHTLVL